MKRHKISSLVIAFVFALLVVTPFDVLAKGGGGFSGGGGSRGGGFSSSSSSSRSYSSPSSSSSRSYSSPSSSSSSSPSRSYSAPSAPTSSSRYSSPSVPSASSRVTAPEPPKSSVVTPGGSRGSSGYDAGTASAKAGEQSRKSFEASQPKTATASAPDRKDRQIQSLKTALRDKNYENRELRNRETFGRYSGYSAPCCYHDPFGNVFFWMWLMDRPTHDRDRWVYSHRDEMDPVRYEELRQKDKDLDRRMKALEAQGVAKDPTYTLEGLSHDQMYSDDHIAKVANEIKAEDHKSSWASFGLWFLVIGLVFGVGYLVFVKRWNVRGA